jgi:WD40 repeat protein
MLGGVRKIDRGRGVIGNLPDKVVKMSKIAQVFRELTMKTLTSLFIVGLVILATSVEFNRNSFVRVEREQSQFLLAETQDSVYQVDQMARLGRGVVHGLTWLPGREELAVTTAIGIWKYKISDLDSPELFEIQMGWHSATALSPNGVILASGSKDNIADNYVVQLWDVQSGKLLRTIDGFSDSITSIKFSPDSSMLACGEFSWCDTYL